MTDIKNLKFAENKALQQDPDKYMVIKVRTEVVLKSWKSSLFSFEWLRPDGTIKDPQELSENEWPKRAAVERMIEEGKPIEMPVLGIGMLENIEFGIGRAEFLTLTALGVKTIPVHIPKTSEKDFKAVRAEVE